MNYDKLTEILIIKLKDKEHCIFIRTNPDEKDFNIFKEINKIHRHVKKFLIDKI